MKMKRMIALMSAAAITLGALPVFSVGAEETSYSLGDVDMDGVITGHDSAMVSRALYLDPNMLTAEQKQLADVNEDGVIDQADADWIHENEVYGIGDMMKTGRQNPTLDAAFMAMSVYSLNAAGWDIQVVKEPLPAGHPEYYNGWNIDTSKVDPEEDWDLYSILFFNEVIKEKGTMSELNYHLIDADGDGRLTMDDGLNLLWSYSRYIVGLDAYFKEGRYDLYDVYNISGVDIDNAQPQPIPVA